MNAVSLDHTFDQAISLHVRRVDFTAGTEQFERSSDTYDGWKPDRRACAGKSAPFCLRRRKADMVAGDPDVAGKGEFDSAGANVTVQAGDDDLRQGFDRIESLVCEPDQVQNLILGKLSPQCRRQNARRKAFGSRAGERQDLDLGVRGQIARYRPQCEKQITG
jgi:hypothetical protein